MFGIFRKAKQGFTIIEMIIVILLCAIMAAIAIPQFIDYRKEAKDAKTNQYLGAIRTSIATQYSQQILRCGTAAGVWSKAAAIEANNVTSGAGALCTGAQVTLAAEQKFVADATFPSNPWGTIPAATVTACSAGAGCTRCNAAGCNNTAPSGGWCYNESTGDFWADSANNAGVVGAKECNF